MFFIHLIWLPEFSLKNELLLKYVFNKPAIYLNTDKKYKFNFFSYERVIYYMMDALGYRKKMKGK